MQTPNNANASAMATSNVNMSQAQGLSSVSALRSVVAKKSSVQHAPGPLALALDLYEKKGVVGAVPGRKVAGLD